MWLTDEPYSLWFGKEVKIFWNKTVKLQCAFLFYSQSYQPNIVKSIFFSFWWYLIRVHARYMFPGVTVLKGQEEMEVRAPVVISNAGIFNTFQKFLPKEIQDKPGRAQQRQESGDILSYIFLILIPATLFPTQRFNHCWVECVMVWVLSWSLLVWMDPRRSWALSQLTSGCIKAMI